MLNLNLISVAWSYFLPQVSNEFWVPAQYYQNIAFFSVTQTVDQPVILQCSPHSCPNRYSTCIHFACNTV